jgi:flavin reductase (DIM6/NTAB) family NADH-FMN oxidoreductase RutF
MTLDFETLAPRDAYTWMVHAVTPRPIAWVSTISAAGKTNLAPFSYFQAVCSKPPMLMFCGAIDRTGKKKDSVINAAEVPEFVVNIVSYALVEPMNATAAPLPHGESEFEKFGIATAPSLKVRPPRVAAAPVAFECKMDRILELGDGPQGSNIVFGRIVQAHVADNILGADGQIDPRKLDSIGRMGGNDYVRTTELFSLVRPAGGGGLDGRKS